MIYWTEQPLERQLRLANEAMQTFEKYEMREGWAVRPARGSPPLIGRFVLSWKEGNAEGWKWEGETPPPF